MDTSRSSGVVTVTGPDGPRPGPSLPTALIVAVLGALIVGPSAALLAIRVVRTIAAPIVTVPGTTDRHLTPGTWVVFEHTGTRSGFVTRYSEPTLSPADISVTAPDGTAVGVGDMTASEVITRGSDAFTGVGQFHVTTSGTYHVTVTSPTTTEILVTKSLGQTVRDVVPFLESGAAGGLLLVAGIVMLIVGSARRSRARKAAYFPAVPAVSAGRGGGAGTPPGWYPDPWFPNRRRWWDGNTWTQHST